MTVVEVDITRITTKFIFSYMERGVTYCRSGLLGDKFPTLSFSWLLLFSILFDQCMFFFMVVHLSLVSVKLLQYGI